MDQHRSHLQPDGSTFPPVTPDPPLPPGYVDPLLELEDRVRSPTSDDGAATAGSAGTADEGSSRGDPSGGA